jgi:hypothetical protein
VSVLAVALVGRTAPQRSAAGAAQRNRVIQRDCGRWWRRRNLLAEQLGEEGVIGRLTVALTGAPEPDKAADQQQYQQSSYKPTHTSPRDPLPGKAATTTVTLFTVTVPTA